MSQLFQQLPPVIPRNSEFFRTNFFRRNNKCTMAWIIIIIIATILRRHRARFTSKRASVYNPEYTHSRLALCLTTRAPRCVRMRAREREREMEKEREREGVRKVCGETSRGESNNWLFQFLALRSMAGYTIAACSARHWYFSINKDIPR